MSGAVHGGSLGRWFEELCRLKHPYLREVVRPRGSDFSLVPNALPSQGGVYAFWWVGGSEALRSPEFNRQVHLHGPNGRTVRLRVDDEWLGLEADLPIPLYIGKTADSLSKRVGKHLLLGTPTRVIPRELGPQRHKAPTTSCQLRAGVEHHFLELETPIPFILDNVALSYVILDGDDAAANRFYLEDLSIGLMRPPINIDVER